ncbi:MAG: Rid family detoxifying hydrolase [Candidatus Eiseniibacteriota bacterium]
MSRAAVASPDAPKAVGPYSQAQLLQLGAARFLFTSGQIGLDPRTNDLVEGVAAQTKQVLANLEAVLAASGFTLADVVKTTVFLAEMSDFDAMNKVYAQAFDEPFPARSTVAAKSLPKGGLVEIEVIAARPGL